MLCSRGAQLLQSKSVNVEDAANELINMLCVEDDVMQEDGDEAEAGAEAEGEKSSARHPSASPSGRKSGEERLPLR